MAFKLVPPLAESYELTESDKKFENVGDPTVITVRQATKADDENRNRLFALWTRTISKDESVTVTSPVTGDDIVRKQVFLTLASCNITNESGTELFRFKSDRLDMTETEFAKEWGKLPLFLTEEIAKCVAKANPQWGPEGNE